ncbi:hypothetical protein [Desulfomonile tiedjei]|uniref:Uncharacterized protein n=1 Tax=Desulfomonile tiedjei (strain ATCC 49306 / DSM 6799 / DCB-1) TaxID=706587 RepID=I4BZX3_DESTA|nr:hypothetical protein [Desulfomonile tiedjei]AFM22864.1 hypothetical protein Desti_0116 [Desulfomonile tiedjei DSM 6799]
MYWWNVSKLAEDLREGRVQEKERFKYYIAAILMYSIVLELAPFFPETFNMVEFISSAVGVIITIAGTILCYRVNRNGDNTDFIGRMICLSWPVSIKIGVLFSAIFIVTKTLFHATFGIDANFRPVVAAFDMPLEVFFYWLLYKYVKLVARPKEAANPDLPGPVFE